MSKNIFVLMKFVEKYNYAKNTQKGKLYMNTVKYYRNIEEKESYLRKDMYEGVTFNGQPNKSELYINGRLINPQDIIGSIKISHNKDLLNHMYCMYSLYCENNCLSKEDIKIAKKVEEFGDWVIVILNVKEFIRRINETLQRMKIKYDWRLVEYIDMDSYHGEINLFKKHNNFSYQNEFRIILNNYSDEPFILDIGDISDISMIMETKKIFNSIKIEKKI